MMSMSCGTACPVNSFCAAFPEECRAVLCESARPFSVDIGDVHSMREIGESLLIMQQGLIVGRIPTISGKTISFSFFGSGSVINLARLGDEVNDREPDWNKGHQGYAVAPVRGCLVPILTFERLSRQDARVSRQALLQALKQYKNSNNYSLQMQECGSAGKLEWFLRVLQENGIDLSTITHATIADLLNMSRITVTRGMKDTLGKISG